MLRRMANAASTSHVFECPGCAGQWVDHDDLVAMILDETSEEDRTKATQRMFYERFGEPVAREEHHEERKRQRMRAVGDVFWAIGPHNEWLDERQFRRHIERDG